MTREELSQASHIRKEIKMLEEKIKETYNQLNSMNVSGMPRAKGKKASEPERAAELLEQQKEKLQELKANLIAEQNRILEFVETISDSRTRQSIIYKYLDGLTWPQVMRKMGYCESVEALKMRVHRLFNS